MVSQTQEELQRVQSDVQKLQTDHYRLRLNPLHLLPFGNAILRPVLTVDMLPKIPLLPKIPPPPLLDEGDIPALLEMEIQKSTTLFFHEVYHTMGLETGLRDPIQGKAPMFVVGSSSGFEVGRGIDLSDPTRGLLGPKPSTKNELFPRRCGSNSIQVSEPVQTFGNQPIHDRKGYQIQTSSVRLSQDFSYKLEQVFKAESTPEHVKIRLVMLHLEGKALQWHHLDPMVELVDLRQVNSIEQYFEEFIMIYWKPFTWLDIGKKLYPPSKYPQLPPLHPQPTPNLPDQNWNYSKPTLIPTADKTSMEFVNNTTRSKMHESVQYGNVVSPRTKNPSGSKNSVKLLSVYEIDDRRKKRLCI
ncbi:hypothetical protein GQ457_08G017770 [Hibiscus cannabinus]